MKKHSFFAAITFVLLVLVLVFIFVSGEKENISIKVPPTSVELSQAKQRNVPVRVQATGQLIAPQSVLLKSQIAGIVDSIDFQSGQYVKKGALLMSLDDTKQTADVNAALADYTQAKAQYERTLTLFNDNQVVSHSELDDAKSAYLKAKAQYQAAQYQLSNTRIIAPFSGDLTLTNLTEGSYVSAGDNLVGLVDKENLEVAYALDETYAESLAIGQTVRFRTDAFQGKVFQAKVSYISPDVSSDNLTFTVRASFDNKADLLSPGMSVYVSQVLDSKHQVLSVPESALSAESGGFIVYLVDHGKAKAQSVRIGQIDNGYVSIRSGLNLGDKVITSADGILSDGQTVKVGK